MNPRPGVDRELHVVIAEPLECLTHAPQFSILGEHELNCFADPSDRRFIFPSAARAHAREARTRARRGDAPYGVHQMRDTGRVFARARERERHFRGICRRQSRDFRGPAAGKRPVWRRFTSLGRFHDTRSARRVAVSDQPSGASVASAERGKRENRSAGG